MRINLLFASSLVLAACTGDSAVTGIRADGLEVTCEAQGEGLTRCTPADGDDKCEGWKDGGPANVLWPPNHKLVRLSLEDCANVNPGCEPPPPGEGGDIIFASAVSRQSAGAPVAITKITADEPVEVGAGGDGRTADYDVAIIDDVTFDLRAERQGKGDGRVYRVHYVDADNAAGACEFLVPHDRGPTGGAVDSGTAVTVTR
jgi:hypothetical protein